MTLLPKVRSQLHEEAERRARSHGRLRFFGRRQRRGWHRAPVVSLAVLFGLAGAALASGVLTGSPVKPEVPASVTSGNGLPLTSASTHLVLLAADPGGGLPWGVRIEHTTRGQLCIQVGRVKGAQLGELGLDSAFGNDGRFHPLPATVLPPGYGGSAGQVECGPEGQTVIFEDLNADRSGVRLLPSEFSGPPPKHVGEDVHGVPPVADLRALAYGVLGPHAVSITYRTPSGMRTIPVSRPDGGFLIVEPAGSIKSQDTIGGSFLGTAEAASVDVGLPGPRVRAGMITAATFRFGARLCSQGVGSPVTTLCPTRKLTFPRHPVIRRLNGPVHLTLLAQSHAACNAAYLKFPCYKGLVEFTAPYAVNSAESDYTVEGIAKCKIGGRVETAWSLERDVKAGQPIRTDSLGLFIYAPSCASTEKFQVSYQGPANPRTANPAEKVIIGTVALAQATLQGGGKPRAPE